MPIRRMLPFILINIIVSVVVVLAILFLWDLGQKDQQEAAVAPLTNTPMPVSSPVFSAQSQSTAPANSGVAAQGPDTYQVKAGDTLGSISIQFDVSMEAIMEANGLDNANFLQVDQVLIIPGNTPPDEAGPVTETPAPEARPTPLPAELPTDGEAVISIANVVGPGRRGEEAVAITNTGERPIALLGWRITDEAGHVYTFDQVTLFGEGAAILVHTGKGPEGPADLYWGFDDPIWKDGDTITLLDGEGVVRATFVIGSD